MLKISKSGCLQTSNGALSLKELLSELIAYEIKLLLSCVLEIFGFSLSKKMTNWCAQNIQGMFKLKKLFQLLIATMSNLGTHICQ